MSPGPRASRLVALIMVPLLSSVVLPLAAHAEVAPATSSPLPRSPSSALLPSWARTYVTDGSRDVWVLPAYDADEQPWSTADLLAQVNGELGWFSTMSHGRFAMRATTVLDPLHFDSGKGNSCDAAARVLAPAISRFYADAPKDAFLVALTRSSDCPYSAVGDTPGRSLILTGFSPASLASEHQLLHELGHNLGLPHSSGYSGGLLSSTSAPGALGTGVREYGSTTDVMGSTGGSLRLSAASLAALGWGDGVTHVPSGTPGTYVVTVPEVSAPGPDAAIVDDPISGRRYSFTFVDDPRVIAVGVPPAGRGVYLHEVPLSGALPGDYGRSSLSYLMPWEGSIEGGSMGMGAGPGTTWVSATGALGLRILSLDRDGAHIAVTVDPTGALTDVAGPSWPMAPSLDTRERSSLAMLVLPAAWDQSGVTGYRVSATGADVLSVHLPSGLVSPGSATIAIRDAHAVITVTATDGAGNMTTWRRSLRSRTQ